MSTATTVASSLFWNVSGYDDARGAHDGVRRVERLGGIADVVTSTQAHVLAFAELSGTHDNHMVDAMDAETLDHNRAPGGGKGTHLYLRDDLKLIDSGQFELYPRFEGNDKQCSWVVWMKDGRLFLDGVAHLTPQALADSDRRGQAKRARAGLIAIAHGHKVPLLRTALHMDSNSEARVADDAEAQGWHSAVRIADRTVNSGYRTLNQWKPTKKGPQIDLTLVPAGVTIDSHRTARDHRLADHNRIHVVRRVPR